MPKKEISNSARHRREELIYAHIMYLSSYYTDHHGMHSYERYVKMINQKYERRLFPRSKEGSLVTKAS